VFPICTVSVAQLKMKPVTSTTGLQVGEKNECSTWDLLTKAAGRVSDPGLQFECFHLALLLGFCPFFRHRRVHLT